MNPPEMQGLTDEQVMEVELRDEWSDRSFPGGGSIINHDPIWSQDRDSSVVSAHNPRLSDLWQHHSPENDSRGQDSYFVGWRFVIRNGLSLLFGSLFFSLW